MQEEAAGSAAKRSIRTRAVHHPDAHCEATPVSAPIYQSATFRLPDVETGARYSETQQPESYYSRWGNPTVQVWEKVVADLEGAERGIAFSSGMAAISTTLFALLRPGDHVVASPSLYAATTEILNRELRQFGVESTFVDPTDPNNFHSAVRPNTKLIYLESPDNPRLLLTDMAAVAQFARSKGILTVADNTFASPYNQRPLEWGVDIVLHSATKYLSGHSDVVAGIVVTRNELAQRIWRMQKLLGGCLDPHAAWLLLRGAKTLAIRVERSNENAMTVARALEEHPQVASVVYPGLPSHPQHELARKQMHGYGGMVSFEVRGGRDAGIRFVQKTKLAVLGVSLGGVETLIEHPASMTHAPLTDEELQKTGISPGLIRLSVGIEDAGDLIADLNQALS